VNNLDGPRSCIRTPGDDRTFSRDSLERALLDVAVRAVARRDCVDLDRVPVLGRHGGLSGSVRRGALTGDAWADAVPADMAGEVHAEAVAAWIVGRYPAPAYPAAVLGSAHGGAVHLAAGLGAPWLPTSFVLNVQWPDGAAGDWQGALRRGSAVAAEIVGGNPDVTVRQVHDPVRRGPLSASTLTLYVRWRRLPAAYREFLATRLDPGGRPLLLRDTRTWPVRIGWPGFTFQVGSPVTGWRPGDHTTANPSFAALLDRLGGGAWAPPDHGLDRRYAELAGEPALEADLRAAAPGTSRVLYPTPGTLSACVADLYRDRLLREGRGGDRCQVETERLLDPWQVLAAGLVPYWCESAAAPTVAEAECWLAGSEPFTRVDVLPAPPGTDCDAHATPAQWLVPAWFAEQSGHLDRTAMRRYPELPMPTSHAAAALLTRERTAMPPSRLPMAEVLAGLRRSGGPLGILVA
jgi:hypothetical protein